MMKSGIIVKTCIIILSIVLIVPVTHAAVPLKQTMNKNSMTTNPPVSLIKRILNFFKSLTMSRNTPSTPPATSNPIPTIRLGDVDNDGNVDFDDINAFRYAIFRTELEFLHEYPNGKYWAGDCNLDGIVDANDIDPFVALLGIRLGDMNFDAVINFDDINPFRLGLFNPAEYLATYHVNPVIPGDCNFDGVFNSDDIDPFVALLSN